MDKMKKLGITGKMASGKTTFAHSLIQWLTANGRTCLYLSVDEIRRRLIGENDDLKQLLRQHFQTADPARLSHLVFSAPEQTAHYNSLINPYILKYVCKAVATASAADFLLLEWARLVEDGYLPLVDYNLAVTCCPDKELIRRLNGGDLSETEINGRLQNQTDWLCNRKTIENICFSAGGKLFFVNTEQPLTKSETEKYFEQPTGI